MTFNELGLKDEILRAIQELGYENAMPIQERSIPFMMNQTKDLVALAQTGTGKTAAFGLPILNLLDTQKRETQALILAPTRELCIQIANDLKNYSKYMKGMKVVPVYGGENIITQLRQLDTPPQIIVATPGRLIDLIERRKVHLGAVNFMVLDEADEMLNMGFVEDITTIFEQTPETRRTMLFSATMPNEIATLSRKYMKEREEISVGKKNSGTENVEHVYYMVQAKDRYLALKRIVDLNPDIYGIVFCRTRQETKDIAEKLMNDGYSADALHGDLSQSQRDAVMQKFRIKNIQVLVATDVAARGLDVNNLTHVINYNLPDDNESYTHRSGRTGRANKTGVSVSIVHSREKNRIRDIERIIGRKFEQKQIPNGMDICKKQLFALIDKMENVEVNSEQLDPMFPEILKKLEYIDKEDIVKRFVSLEFNRFLDYYKNAPDLNISERDGARGGDFKRGGSAGSKVRLKINLGSNENFSPNRLLGMLNDATGDKSITVTGIEVTNKFTFFDVFADQSERVVSAFSDMGEAKVDIAKGGRGNGGGKDGSYRGNSGGYRGRSEGSSGGGGYRGRTDSRSGSGYRGNSGSGTSSSTGSDKPWRRERSNQDKNHKDGSSGEQSWRKKR
ncbi:MAG: DEAD/DEAH box helicase [Paludibacteraceae bacterium]|nr:DEAD/DEAH box helicase [Paludibacteraceae bacterium]MBN2788100.1 DEAD/DEAH box helicase [Paludibacteraceae bacterium]